MAGWPCIMHGLHAGSPGLPVKLTHAMHPSTGRQPVVLLADGQDSENAVAAARAHRTGRRARARGRPGALLRPNPPRAAGS